VDSRNGLLRKQKLGAVQWQKEMGERTGCCGHDSRCSPLPFSREGEPVLKNKYYNKFRFFTRVIHHLKIYFLARHKQCKQTGHRLEQGFPNFLGHAPSSASRPGSRTPNPPHFYLFFAPRRVVDGREGGGGVIVSFSRGWAHLCARMCRRVTRQSDARYGSGGAGLSPEE